MMFVDRDISWIKFNERVLDQTERNIPLAEKLMFIGITADNLDEFLMSRYPRRLGYEPVEMTEDINNHFQEINRVFKEINDKEDLFISPEQVVSKDAKKEIQDYFDKKLQPIIYSKLVSNKTLSPKSKELNIFVELYDDKRDEYSYCNITVPTNIPRFVYLKSLETFMTTENIISMNYDKMYRGKKVIRSCNYMITRSVNMIYNDENMDLYSIISKSLKSLNESWITSVQCSEPFTKKSISRNLRDHLEINENTNLLGDIDIVGMYMLKTIDDSVFAEVNRKRKSVISNPFQTNVSIFDLLKDRDRLVYHPFESFDNTVSKFVADAADDPNVLSIRMTLYRIPKESRIIDALLRATEMNKSVAVMVELKARFNEKDNLNISRILKEAGVDIIYSDEILKTHAKMCIVTRKEKEKIKIYSHISTGNYSQVNSKIYTDYSYFTDSTSVGRELTEFFNMLSNPTLKSFDAKEIIYAPHNMREELRTLIKEQVKLAKSDKGKGRILIKCNALTDIDLAEELYKASKAGVKITLLVRGACIIKTDIPEAKNIKVVSIVGKYLEHSRVYMFGSKKERKVFIGSSDLMYRNLSRRYELLIRIRNEDMIERISKHMEIYLRDNVNSYVLKGEKYQKVKVGEEIFNAHQILEKEAKKRSV